MRFVSVIILGLCALYTWLVFYFGMPSLGLRFGATWFIAASYFGFAALYFWARSEFEESPLAGILAKIGGGIIFIYLILLFVNCPLFRAKSFYQLAGTVEQKESIQNLPALDMDKMPIVKEGWALKIGSTLLSKYPKDAAKGTLTQMDLSQDSSGRWWWIGPVEPRRVRNVMSDDGSFGFVKISASNPQINEYVREINGKPLRLRYLKTTITDNYVTRLVYFAGYSGYSISDDNITFELDDSGNPWWVVTLLSPTIGVSMGDVVAGIVLVNPVTGEVSQFYTPEQAPNWVELVQDEDVVYEQVAYWGEYPNGFGLFTTNTENEREPVSKPYPIFGTDGRKYFYIDQASDGGAGARGNGSVGCVMVDSRTGEKVFYTQAGYALDSAKVAIERPFNPAGKDPVYYAEFCGSYNVEGAATYAFTVWPISGAVDDVHAYGLFDQESGASGVGRNLIEARNAYRMNLAMKLNRAAPGSGASLTKPVTGKISQITTAVLAGNTNYYFVVDDVRYYASVSISQELPYTNIGHQVKILSSSSGATPYGVMEFDNLNIPNDSDRPVVATQVAVNDYLKKDTVRAAREFDNLSPGEKVKLLEQQKARQ